MDFNDNKQDGGNFQDRPKPPMIQGNWKCADCGGEITELPFEPRAGSEVRCRDCYRKNRPPRRDFRR